MKLLVSVIVSLSAFSAQADIIKCTFTEPFINFEYSMTQSRLTVIDPVSNYPAVIKTKTNNVSFQIMGPGHFELWDKNKNVLAVLFLTYNGSDGMSDNVFPYDVQFVGYGGLRGGCTSNFQPIVVDAEALN